MRRSTTTAMLCLVALALWGAQGWGAIPAAPATLNATGTSITLDEGPYPGLTFECDVPVRLMLTTTTGFVTMSVEADQPPAGVVNFTMRGLPASSFWYLYIDDLVEPLTYTADEAGVVTFPLDLSMDRFVSLQNTHSTYIIKNDATGGDCTTFGLWNASTRTCTLNRDLYEGIVFGASYLTIDGAGHTIHNSGGYGVYASWNSRGEKKPGLRVYNLNVDGGAYGIFLNKAPGSRVENVNVMNATTGITLWNGSYTLRDSTVSNAWNGIDSRFAGFGSFTRLDVGPVSGTGMYMWYTSGTMTDSVIHDCPVGIFANAWSAHNNIFRDCDTEITGTSGLLNIDAAPGPNIVGGPFIGGNYYTKSDGTGFSDTAVDVNPHDGFADQPNVFGDYLVDNLPLVIYSPYINIPPVLAPIGDQTVLEGETLSFTLSATDENEGETLTFSAANLPPGALFDPVTATFTWTPWYDQVGVYSGIEFTVTDDGTPIELDAEVISITVGNTNRPPVFSSVGPQSVEEYSTLTFGVWATDPDGDAVDLQAGELPRGAAFDPVSGVFSWRPDGLQAGVYPIYFFATDDGIPQLTAELGIVVTVGQVISPISLIQMLITEINARIITEPEINSYIANLKKVEIFIEDGKLGPAINQVEAFIQKCDQDIEHGVIPHDDGEYLLLMAYELLNLLQG